MDRVKQLLVNDWCSANATNLKSPSCRTLLVLILWGATKWDKPAKWEGSPLARLVPLRGPLLYTIQKLPFGTGIPETIIRIRKRITPLEINMIIFPTKQLFFTAWTVMEIHGKFVNGS